MARKNCFSGEKRHDQVYGETFSSYSNNEMTEFIEFFEARFESNGLSAKNTFKGKKCFDAGCGNGRGSLFMLKNGARQVTSCDISKQNVENTRKFANEFGFRDKIKVVHGSLADIPFEDSTFDFVWCNGVIMHTKHPNKCLSEITRILKVEGQCWLYMYGAGGLYWRVIYHLREMMKDTPIQNCITMLKLFGYSPRYVAEFIDDWYTPFLRTYTYKDLSLRLIALGWEKPELLRYGVGYDTSHRRNMFTSSRQRSLMGHGDLRFIIKKKKNEKDAKKHLISENEYGSEYRWPKVITENIDPLFNELIDSCGENEWLKTGSAANLMRKVRIELSQSGPFRLNAFTSAIAETNAWVRSLNGRKR